VGEGVGPEFDFFGRASIAGAGFKRHFGASIVGIVENTWKFPMGVCFILNATRQRHSSILPSTHPSSLSRYNET
jgi:hypothetical protein